VSKEVKDEQASRATVFGVPRLRNKAPTGPRAWPATASGAVAIGALAVGAAAIGGFAIGRLSVGRLAVGRASVGRLKLGEVEIDRLTLHEQKRTDVPEVESP
jgi:hypothetical protein